MSVKTKRYERTRAASDTEGGGGAPSGLQPYGWPVEQTRSFASGPDQQPIHPIPEKRRGSADPGESAVAPKLTYTMAEVAQALGVSYITIWRLMKRGRLKAVRGLRRKLIPASELDRFLKDVE